MCKTPSHTRTHTHIKRSKSIHLTVYFALQVCRSLQPEGRLPLPSELGHLPGQHGEHHRGQLWRKRQRLPGRQANARHLPASGNLWGGRSDNGGKVRKKARGRVNASKQTNIFPRKLDGTGCDSSLRPPRRSAPTVNREAFVRVFLWARWLSRRPFAVCFREFINMGFVDQNRVAIWGWVRHPDFALGMGRKKKEHVLCNGGQ